MRTGAPAFRAGDQLKLKTAHELNAIWTSVTANSPLSLHHILDPHKERLAENLVHVVEVREYHFGFPVYRLEGHRYVWPEESLIDPVLDASCKIGDPCCAANLVYRAFAVDKRIEIVDCENFVYCALAKTDPKWAAKEINEIASIRHLRAFEYIFGFEGKDFVNPGPFLPLQKRS